MKRLAQVLVFTIGFPILLLSSLQMTRIPTELKKTLAQYPSPEGNILGTRVFAALPDTTGTIDFDIQPADARTLILKNYLQQFNSPLLGLEPEIIQASDQYHLDFRLLVSIARQESGLCEFIPSDSYNCWGWGIHEQGTLTFANYQQAIWEVARGLREDYLDRGLTTHEQIMSRYTPQSDGSWASAIEQFFVEME